jgi:Na+/proline symporter
MSYYWKRATKWGALCTVLYGVAMTLYGSWAVLYKKVLGMGTMEWLLVLGCGAIYFVVSALTRPPSAKTLDLLFPVRK